MPEPAGETRRPAVVVNPTKILDGPAVKKQVIDAFTGAGWAEPLWIETTEEDPGYGQTKQALEQGADLVCALGGDGTVRVVASALVGEGVPLGILPGGTGNLLARQLEMDLDSIDEALAVVIEGEDMTIDVGELELQRPGGQEETHHFLVMAGVGFDAKMMAEAPEDLKKRVGWMAYTLSGLKNLPGRRVKAQLVVDDERPVTRRMRSVLVANCGRLTGGLELVPTASVRDGSLDAVVLSPKGLIGWASLALAVATKSTKGHKRIEHRPCRKLVVTLVDPIQAELDGDPVGKVVGATATVLPGALKVRVALGTR